MFLYITENISTIGKPKKKNRQLKIDIAIFFGEFSGIFFYYNRLHIDLVRTQMNFPARFDIPQRQTGNHFPIEWAPLNSVAKTCVVKFEDTQRCKTYRRCAFLSKTANSCTSHQINLASCKTNL